VSIELTKDSIDIGIVVRDSAAALKFYCDTLGLEHVTDVPFPFGGTMHRLACGSTVVKLVRQDDLPAKSDNGGGPQGASGIRYWTISVKDLAPIAEKCRAGGYVIAMEPTEIRPGVRICMIEDPDGNWVELLEING
jgi:glyoxylase I family protein